METEKREDESAVVSLEMGQELHDDELCVEKTSTMVIEAEVLLLG